MQRTCLVRGSGIEPIHQGVFQGRPAVGNVDVPSFAMCHKSIDCYEWSRTAVHQTVHFIFISGLVSPKNRAWRKPLFHTFPYFSLARNVLPLPHRPAMEHPSLRVLPRPEALPEPGPAFLFATTPFPFAFHERKLPAEALQLQPAVKTEKGAERNGRDHKTHGEGGSTGYIQAPDFLDG